MKSDSILDRRGEPSAESELLCGEPSAKTELVHDHTRRVVENLARTAESVLLSQGPDMTTQGVW